MLLQVAPRADPSPENTHPGLVLLHPVGGQWFTQVLARGAPWYGDGDFRDTAPAQPFAWSVVRDGARRRLVIGYVTSVTDENPSGHGHGSWPLYAALRIALVAGEPRVDGLCDRDEYPDPGNHVWRSSHIACVDGEGRTRPLAACTWTHFAEPWDREGPGPWVRSERDAATAAWCRAFARGPRHRL